MYGNGNSIGFVIWMGTEPLVLFPISRATLSVINILRRQVRTSQETEKQWVVLHLPEASRNSTRLVQTDKSVSSPVSE
ncbi:hypothetical protein CDEST_14539 [Colletotrichum destructivum]|uniref:Uncharacterized protein n=1 Tax=Colletotrichum destructivum TaxID=34406 RepID=A0AAX4J2G9_9PEZI|nr:hypothetical protein CDEST_14539 [Colletotrichum destructivum]